MNTVVTVVLIAAMVSLAVGIITPLIPFGRNRPHQDPIMVSARPIYWRFSAWTVLIGVILIGAPNNWYGPSWHYFSLPPHNGVGMGVCLTVLATLQMLALWRDASVRILSALFFLIGNTYWTAGMVLGTEGLLGHQGLMEAPFMMLVGAHAFALKVELTVRSRRDR